MSVKRKHLRLPLTSNTFIELESSGIDTGDNGKVIGCKTVNVSRAGMLVNLSQPLSVGAILQIGIDIAGQPKTLYLAGEVRWCLRNKNTTEDSEKWQAGFQILNASGTDIDRWNELISKIEK